MMMVAWVDSITLANLMMLLLKELVLSSDVPMIRWLHPKI